MSSLPPELTGPVEHLRATLIKINDSELTCMTTTVATASQTKSLPEVQAIMAKCRQASAAAAATAINTFRHECFEIGKRATSLAQAAIVAATATSVSGFWATSESTAAAVVSEAAAALPAHGPNKTTQAITNTYRDRASAINLYFEQLCS
jgi:hypothetical protein